MTVSIVTVAYNSASTIADTLRSVLEQTHRDIEYWVIDGASTDGTLDIVRQWQPRFEGRLHLVSEPDKGIYDAMNKGVKRCTGDVVGILNSDDFFTSPTVIAQIAEAFAADAGLQVVYGDVHYVRPDDLSRCVRYYSGHLYRPWLAPYGFMPPHPSLYVRRQVYTTYGLYRDDMRISSDYEFITRICLRHRLAYRYLHLDVVTMRMGGASTDSVQSRVRGTEEDLIACRDLGIQTNRLMIYLKYPIKIFSALFIRK